MNNRLHISRRTLLRGMGAALALPWLEAMGPMTSWAGDTVASQAAPNRMAFFYVPNGVNMDEWKPKQEGALGELPKTLSQLDAHKKDFSVLTGLTADKARANGDGGGDHARALSAYLTGCQPRKTDGTDIRAGVSVDQVAAGRLASKTRLGSIELGTEAGSMAGNCDSGYSCVYSSTMSWRSATQPLPKEVNPKLVFERLFGSGSKLEREKRDAQRKSVLDIVKADFGELNGKLGKSDQRKLDEYFSAVRDLELRIERAATMPDPKAPENFAAPTGVPSNYEEHIRIMADLMIAAFQTDSTRVCTFVLANEGSNKTYPFIDVKDGHHSISHHQGKAENLAKLTLINQFHMRQFAYVLERMKSIKEGNGTLLDHAMLCYGSANSDGNRHNHDDLPLVLAGRGCGTIQPGRHIIYPKETPINNLWLSLLNRMEIHTQQLGDSTGELKGLAAT